jgi:hypothetical protein
MCAAAGFHADQLDVQVVFSNRRMSLKEAKVS